MELEMKDQNREGTCWSHRIKIRTLYPSESLVSVIWLTGHFFRTEMNSL